MFERCALSFLQDWKTRTTRKPLVVRGARQVGKTKLISDLFGRREFSSVAEFNFEAQRDLADLFASNDPAKIVPMLETVAGMKIADGETLLFLDEIQAAPQVLASLRYFHEKRPGLHVAAAGSLLEFALADFGYSMPVGRVEYLFMEPLSFEEFLAAIGADALCEWIGNWRPGDAVPDPIHRECMEKVLLYWIVGGLPEAVSAYTDTGSFIEVERVQQSLCSTYMEDFSKYRRRIPQAMLEAVFKSLPQQMGKKFSYVSVSRDAKARELGEAVKLLEKALLLARVNRSPGNALPLGAGEDSRNFKAFSLDIGLAARQMGLGISSLRLPADSRFIAERGGFCEQFVAQNLKCAMPGHVEHILHHWGRAQSGSEAEVDFLLQAGSSVVPLEVKAGSSGTMRSLHRFLLEKGTSLGVRINGDKPSYVETVFPDGQGGRRPFRLLSLPFYLCGHAIRFAETAIDGGIVPFRPD